MSSFIKNTFNVKFPPESEVKSEKPFEVKTFEMRNERSSCGLTKKHLNMEMIVPDYFTSNDIAYLRGFLQNFKAPVREMPPSSFGQYLGMNIIIDPTIPKGQALLVNHTGAVKLVVQSSDNVAGLDLKLNFSRQAGAVTGPEFYDTKEFYDSLENKSNFISVKTLKEKPHVSAIYDQVKKPSISKTLSGLGKPTSSSDAVSKEYIDIAMGAAAMQDSMKDFKDKVERDILESFRVDIEQAVFKGGSFSSRSQDFYSEEMIELIKKLGNKKETDSEKKWSELLSFKLKY